MDALRVGELFRISNRKRELRFLSSMPGLTAFAYLYPIVVLSSTLTNPCVVILKYIESKVNWNRSMCCLSKMPQVIQEGLEHSDRAWCGERRARKSLHSDGHYLKQWFLLRLLLTGWRRRRTEMRGLWTASLPHIHECERCTSQGTEEEPCRNSREIHLVHFIPFHTLVQPNAPRKPHPVGRAWTQ